ncbi:unnamed protein product, partial [marine sediment metagenome]
MFLAGTLIMIMSVLMVAGAIFVSFFATSLEMKISSSCLNLFTS